MQSDRGSEDLGGGGVCFNLGEQGMGGATFTFITHRSSPRLNSHDVRKRGRGKGERARAVEIKKKETEKGERCNETEWG